MRLQGRTVRSERHIVFVWSVDILNTNTDRLWEGGDYVYFYICNTALTYLHSSRSTGQTRECMHARPNHHHWLLQGLGTNVLNLFQFFMRLSSTIFSYQRRYQRLVEIDRGAVAQRLVNFPLSRLEHGRPGKEKRRNFSEKEKRRDF